MAVRLIHQMTNEQWRFIKIVYDYTHIAEVLYKYSKPINEILQNQGMYYTDRQRIMLNRAGRDFIRTYPNMNPEQWKK